ncbi:MAG TPA: zinc ribbon domain-containing protein [Gemmatimonadaceae bacterium]|nr:zinc ribbon domain-containing protein [Gemmatimonadaceae bacterium]
MPTYEYRCPEGHEFEKFVQKMSDAQSELPCPDCGVVAPRRMSAGGGLLFKGSGFYITDYGKDGKKDQRAAAASASPSATAASDAPSGGSAPAASSGGESSGGSGKPAAAPAAAPAPAKSDKPKSGPEK